MTAFWSAVLSGLQLSQRRLLLGDRVLGVHDLHAVLPLLHGLPRPPGCAITGGERDRGGR